MPGKVWTMALKNLVGFVKMAISDNKNIDMETSKILCQYVEDLKVCLDNQDSLVKALRADIRGMEDAMDSLRVRLSRWEKV